MVPAVIVPITFDIIAVISAILGIPCMDGNDLRFIEPGFIDPGLPRLGRLPIFPNIPRFAIGDEVRSRNLLPEVASQRESWPIVPTIASVAPSELKPASLGVVPSISVRNSRPDFTSQIFAWFSRPVAAWPGPIDFFICS